MQLPRRRFLHLAAGAAALPALSRIAKAQAYPMRPVRIDRWLSARRPERHPRSPDGSMAVGAARPAIHHREPARRGQQYWHRGGRARRPRTAIRCSWWLRVDAINATLYEKLNFNFIRDIVPVASISRESSVVAVNASVQAGTVPEFVAYAKANPGKLNMASAGIGAPSHVYGELFNMMAGVSMVHVPYRGVAPALTDLLGGQVQVSFAPVAASIEYIRVGKLRALAVTAATRSEVLPDIPTVGEFVPGYEASSVVWPRCAQEHAGGNHRQAQQGDQCRPRRSQDQDAACRPGRHSASQFGRRLRQAHRRRNREMGQGG